jgi:adenosylhomocysteine nucleosidase
MDQRTFALLLAGISILTALRIAHIFAAPSQPAMSSSPTAATYARGDGRIGLVGALPEEIAKLAEHVTGQAEHAHGAHISVVTGTLHGRPVAFAKSGVGMVAAAAVATVLNEVYRCDALVFTGVAGGLVADLAIGDIVVATDVINYDMDVTGFKLPWDPAYVHKRGEIPFSNMREFASAPRLAELALAAPVPEGIALRRGRIATGSEFLTAARKAALDAVWEAVGPPRPVAVEMECAAVAQVCAGYGTDFLALRAVSDTLSGDASDDFNAFVQTAADNLWHITSHIVEHFGNTDKDQAKLKEV